MPLKNNGYIITIMESKLAEESYNPALPFFSLSLCCSLLCDILFFHAYEPVCMIFQPHPFVFGLHTPLDLSLYFLASSSTTLYGPSQMVFLRRSQGDQLVFLL